jgi:hypothetical protein
VAATGTGSITLTAVGGPVTWTAGVEGGAPAGVTLSATAGTTAAGKSEAVVVVLTDVHQRVRSFDVVIGPGDHVVRVTVDHKKKK